MSDIVTGRSEDKVVDKNDPNATVKKLPKGVVLGKDGKPCRSCTSFASWASMTKKSTADSGLSSSRASFSTTLTPSSDCPPDVEQLGRSTWTFLHALTASYPSTAPPQLQQQTSQFLSLFSKLYPCWVCAEDFQGWMKSRPPEVTGRKEFGVWMCEAHNEVNRKLGKGEFDCGKWEERWRDGWADGRCD